MSNLLTSLINISASPVGFAIISMGVVLFVLALNKPKLTHWTRPSDGEKITKSFGIAQPLQTILPIWLLMILTGFVAYVFALPVRFLPKL